MNAQPQTSASTRVYRMKSAQRVAGIAVFAGGLFFTVAIWGAVLVGTREPRFLEMRFPVVLSIGAATFTVRAFRNKVRLSENAIELYALSGSTVLPFDKIRGRRKYYDPGDLETPGVWHLVLEPNDDRFKKIDIEEYYRFDDFFYEWFNGLQNLDDLDKTRPKPSNFGLV